MLYKYETATTLSLVTVRPDGKKIYHHCGSLADWRPGQWHHVALTWSSAQAEYRALHRRKTNRQGLVAGDPPGRQRHAGGRRRRRDRPR